MDRSHPTFSATDELRQIQFDARQARSVDELRQYFERVQNVRRAHLEEFETQLLIAEIQDEIIDRARLLRDEGAQNGSTPFDGNAPAQLAPRANSARKAEEDESDAAEIAPEVPRVDSKTWQRALSLALFFTLVVLGAFFYLIQTARKINLTPNEAASQTKQEPTGNGSNAPAQAQNTANAPAALPTNPALRLYTDLVPGTVSVDGREPVDLKDGELILDNLQPGRHSIQVNGRSGNAAFSFDVAEKAAPRVVGLPISSNAMTVLVSAQDGEGHLVTNADHAEVLLDGTPAGDVGPEGLTLDKLGKTDHDLQVTEDKDRQRFVLTYTPAPTLTAYVKSDPNAGTVVVMAGQDGADVYINDALYRRKTDHGQLRIPLKVGDYRIRVHKAGFIDPPPEDVTVKKAEESALQFHLQPLPEIATLAIQGALPGTMVYIDKDFAAMIAADGNATISNIKPGDHTVELQRDQALPKRFLRSFHTGDVITLSGPDVALEKVVSEPQPAPAPVAPPPASANTAAPSYSMEMEGSQVRKGGGFVTYHIPKVAGHYSFAAEGRVGGFLKHSKLQWFAGYQDDHNYVLFTLDGKHASIHEIRNGQSIEISRVPFNMDSNTWVQADVSVRPDSISARVKTPDEGWTDIGTVVSPGRDLTHGKVGFYIPSNDEVAVSNFRFSNR